MSVPYGFRDLFLVPPLSFTTATFSKAKPHDQHDRNDTNANEIKKRAKIELTRRHSVVKVVPPHRWRKACTECDMKDSTRRKYRALH